MSARAVLLIALLATGLLYSGITAGGYVYEDANQLQVIAIGHPPVWTLPGRELTMQTYRLVPDPAWAHGLNVALHLGNGALVYALGAMLVDPPVGAAAALIFLLHPLNVEAVRYVTARSDLLLTLCSLLTVWFAVQAVDRGGAWRLVLCLLFALCAALTKEIGIVAGPLAIWTVALWRQDAPRARFVLMLGLTLTGLCVGLAVPVAQRAGGAFMGLQLAALWRLVGLALMPIGLSFDHDALGLASFVPLAYVGTVALLTAAVIAWLFRWRAPLWIVGWIAIGLGPRLVVASPEFLSERWFYVAMPALCLGLGALLAREPMSIRATQAHFSEA